MKKRTLKLGIVAGAAAVTWHACPVAEERKLDPTGEHPETYHHFDFGKLTYEITASTSEGSRATLTGVGAFSAVGSVKASG